MKPKTRKHLGFLTYMLLIIPASMLLTAGGYRIWMWETWVWLAPSMVLINMGVRKLFKWE